MAWSGAMPYGMARLAVGVAFSLGLILVVVGVVYWFVYLRTAKEP